jgi:ABC-type proline/glycine betaine transport system permease subunit
MQIQDALIEHLWISIVPWLVGGSLGGGLGYGVALVVREFNNTRPGYLGIIALFPWRALAFTLAAIGVFNPYAIQLFGPGELAGSISVGLLVFIVALPFSTSTILQYWYPPGPGERLISLARSLGVGAVIIAVLVTVMGAGGAGSLIWTGMREYDYDRFWAGYGLVAILALFLDVLLGAVQMLVTWNHKTS